MQTLSELDLNKNELKRARIENLSEAPSDPVSGQIYFNTTSQCVFYWDGTKWVNMSQPTNQLSTQATSLTCTLPDNL